MGWLIALGIVAVLALLPLGVSVKYDSGGPLARAILGPVKITLYPRKAKKKKEKKPKEIPAPAAQPKQATQEPEQKPKGGSFQDFLPLVKLGMEFLGDFRRKLRVNRLELKLIMAADDPCDLAVNYGRAWAALGNLMPQLEKLFVIRKRNLEVECDFTASETLVTARLDMTITLGRMTALAAVYGVRALKEFLKINQKRKGGASQ